MSYQELHETSVQCLIYQKKKGDLIPQSLQLINHLQDKHIPSYAAGSAVKVLTAVLVAS